MSLSKFEYIKYVQFSLEDKETRAFKKEYDSKMIEVLKAFVDICDTHDLRYVLGYGSVLGAVRHSGIIPWDDDIDVCMPRPDYEEFKKICNDEDVGNYEIYCIEKGNNYIEPYIKFADKNSSLIYNANIPYVCGVMIDIFPIDGADSDENLWKHYSDKYNYLHRIHQVILIPHSLKSLWNLTKEGGWRHSLVAIITTPFKKRLHRYIQKEMNRIERHCPYNNSEMVAFYHRVYGYKERIPKNWVEDRIKHQFESIEVFIPKDYEKYLTHFYGDYMQIPPIEERDKHLIAYINLHKRESIDEIKEKL